jgi:hypothetical protein
MQIKTDFSYPAELHVFNNETLLSDIPPSWSRYTLLMEPINPPILVTQIKLENGDWLYLAALLPAPYMTLDEEVVSPQAEHDSVCLCRFLQRHQCRAR